MKDLLKKMLRMIEQSNKLTVEVSEMDDRYRVDVLKKEQNRLNRLKNDLIERAREKNACTEGITDVENARGIHDLLIVTVKHICWGKNNNILSREYYERNYTQEELKRARIFMDGGAYKTGGEEKAVVFGNSTVRAYDNSEVAAFDNSVVTAFDNSVVTAYDNSEVDAYDHSKVYAYDHSTVKAYDSSEVNAYDSSEVDAYDHSKVGAYDNSKVTASDNSKVTAFDHSTVHAYENSTVKAYENSEVGAYGNSDVHASGNSDVRASDNSEVEASDNSKVYAYEVLQKQSEQLADIRRKLNKILKLLKQRGNAQQG